MVKAVIFDAGGVLHTSEDKYISKSISKFFKIKLDNYRAACEKLIPLLQTNQMSEGKFWKDFIKLTKTKITLPKYSLWTKVYLEKFKLNKEIIKLAEDLKKRGIKIAVLSNAISAHEVVNKKFGIYKPFPTIILSNHVGLRKPNPEIFKLTLRKLGCKPEESVFIDNQLKNIKIAKKMGFLTILFKNQKQLKDSLINLKLIP